jgi:hypothetical protein
MSARRSWGGVPLLVLFCLALGRVPGRGDVFMRQKVHTDSSEMMGQTRPARDEAIVIWYADNKIRMDQTNGKSTLLLADKRLLYVIDHNNKTYTEIPLDMNKAMNEALAGQGEQGQRIAEMMKSMGKGMMGGLTVKVTDTGETKRIGNWNCLKYHIDMKMSMGETSSEAWATEDIKIDPKLYFTAMNAMMASLPGFEDLLREIEKVKGVIVYQVSVAKMMGSDVKSTTEVLECDTKSAPAGSYDLPQGYTKVKGLGGTD